MLVLLLTGHLDAAEKLAQQDELPLSQARVLLAQGDPSAALAVLAPFRRQMEGRGWADERLRAIVLQALALHLKGDNDTALHVLAEALALAEPEGFIRTFVDEGPPMAELLGRMRVEGGRMKEYLHTLLAAFGHEHERQPAARSPQPLPEPLSQRELEVLRLMPRAAPTRRSPCGSSSPWTRSKGTPAGSTTSSRCSGAPRRSPAPATWASCRRSAPHFPAPPQPTLRPTPTCLAMTRGRG